MGFAVMCFIILAEKFEVPNVTELTMVLSVSFAILYVVIFGMMHSPRYRKNAIVTLLFFTVILEIVAADTPKLTMAQPKAAYTSDYELYQEISDRAEEEDTELFYRTELAKLRARMDPSWYDYTGVSVFSSMAYESTAKTMKKLGLFGNNLNSYTYYPQTAVFNSFFAIRYLYDNMNFIQNDKTYTLVDSNEKFEAFRYNYYLPLIFSVDEGITQWDMSSSNPFTVQNNLIYSATGIDNVLVSVEATDFIGENIRDVELSSLNSGTTFVASKSSNGSSGKATVKITPEETGNYYIYVGSSKISYLRVTAKDFSYDYNGAISDAYVLDLGYLTPEDEITVIYTVPEANNSATITFAAARLDEEKFDEAYSIINENGTMEMTVFEETFIEGTINVTNENSFLWTSVPYDESWEVAVDGRVLTYSVYDEKTDELLEEGDIVRVGGGLMGIRADKGEHTITLTYNANGLAEGIELTVFGIAVLALAFIYKRWLKRFFEKIGFVPVFFREPDFEND